MHALEKLGETPIFLGESEMTPEMIFMTDLNISVLLIRKLESYEKYKEALKLARRARKKMKKYLNLANASFEMYQKPTEYMFSLIIWTPFDKIRKELVLKLLTEMEEKVIRKLLSYFKDAIDYRIDELEGELPIDEVKTVLKNFLDAFKSSKHGKNRQLVKKA